MKRPLSAYAKSVAGSLSAFCLAAVAAFGPDSAAGKWLAVAATALGVLVAVLQTKNTSTVETGPGDAVKVENVLSPAGSKVGEVITDTGAAMGGIVEGTTGLIGAAVDATLGKLLPSGQRRS